MSTEFATDDTTTGVKGSEHVTDGSLVSLVVEAGTGVGFIKNVQVAPGFKIRCNRTASTIDFEWRYREPEWQQFAAGAGSFTIASTVNATIWAIDP